MILFFSLLVGLCTLYDLAMTSGVAIPGSFVIKSMEGEVLFNSKVATLSDSVFLGNVSFIIELQWSSSMSIEASFSLNRNLIADDFKVTYLGSTVDPDEEDHQDFDPGAVYTGVIYGGGWISFSFLNPITFLPQLSTSQLIEGSFYRNGILMDISAEVGGSQILILEKKDGEAPSLKCGVDKKLSQAFATTSTATFNNDFIGCSENNIKTLYMGIALDCNFVNSHSSTSEAVLKIVQMWNAVDAIYRSELNINLAILEIVIGGSSCGTGAKWNTQCSANTSLSDILTQFSDWRIARPSDGIGLWHLVTACRTGFTVGLSWLNQVCQSQPDTLDASGITVTGTGVSLGTGASSISIIAHEIGHSFGAMHDCADDCSCTAVSGCTECCYCPATSAKISGCSCQSKYLMAPALPPTSGPVIFSECTKRQICAQIYQSTFKCLFDTGSKSNLAGTSVCGNGIKENGEQCDCGKNCEQSSCCSSNCTLKASAACAPENDACCTSTCEIAKSGTVCRAKSSNCDIDETCDGKGPSCPKDGYIEDGTDCDKNLGYKCASGKCTSKNYQCNNYAKIWGLGLSSSSCATDDSCQMTCKIGESCIVTPSAFVDGTVCGTDGAGKCFSGKCDIKHWFWRWGWIVAVVLGSLLVISLIYDFVARYKRKNRRARENQGNPYESSYELE